jgi:hypothetical protein
VILLNDVAFVEALSSLSFTSFALLSLLFVIKFDRDEFGSLNEGGFRSLSMETTVGEEVL